MQLSSRRRRIILALALIAPGVSLALMHLHPFGEGGWQDFVAGFPIGLAIGAAFALLLCKRGPGGRGQPSC